MEEVLLDHQALVALVDGGADLAEIDPGSLGDDVPPIVRSSFEQLWHSNAYRACINSWLYQEPEPTEEQIEQMIAEAEAELGLDTELTQPAADPSVSES